jgi:hypothetical protein
LEPILEWNTWKVLHLSTLQPYSKNIRLGWKGLPGPLAYYEHLKVTEEQTFATLGQVVNVIKL